MCVWRSYEKSSHIVKSLRDLRHDDALSLFHQIRDNGNHSPSAGSVSPFVRDSHFIRTCLPVTRNDLEFELAVRHPVAYPTLFPIPATALENDDFLKPRKVYHISKIVEDATNTGDHDHFPYDAGFIMAAQTSNVHKCLRSMDISRWTTTALDNKLAAQVLSLYFRIDYPIIPVFHKELFLSDLTSNRSYFCSKLLVCALLSWACVSYNNSMIYCYRHILC